MAYQDGYAGGYTGDLIGVYIPGVNTFQPAAAGYGARLGDYWVRLAPDREAPLHMYTQDSLAPRTDDRTSTEENVLQLGHSFSRTDLTGGAGLDLFPRPLSQDRNVEDNIKFWDSMNIDVARSRIDSEYAIRLHHKLEEWGSLTGVTGLERTPTLLYVADGNLVRWYNTLSNTVEEGNHDFSNPIDSMCSINEDVYALSNNVILKKPAGVGSFSAWHTPGAGETIERIWAAKNRVLAHRTTTTPTSEFLEFSGAGVEAVVDTYDPNVNINDVVDGGPAIITALTSGEFYSYSLDTTSSPPPLEPTSATPLPVGEIPLTMAYNQGALCYITVDSTTAGTTTVARFYAAEVLDSRFNFTIGEAQLIMEWDSAIEVSNRNITDLLALRDEIWFAVYEPDVAGNKFLSLYRYDLVTKGYNRAHAVSVAGSTNPLDLVHYEDRFVFGSDGEVWAESDTGYPTVGWLIGPMYNAGLNTLINWVATVIDGVDVESATLQIELLRSIETEALMDWQDNSWVSEQRIASPYQMGVEVPMLGKQAKQMAMQVRIYPVGSVSPGIRKFALRGLPSHRDLVIELPINISDVVELPHRAPIISPRWGDGVHERLFNFRGKHVELEVLDPPMTMIGVVDQIAEPTEYLTARGSQGRMCMVRIRGQQISTTVGLGPSPVSVGTAGLGVGLLGVGTMGIGQLTEIS